MNQILVSLQKHFKTIEDLGWAFFAVGIVLFGIGDTFGLPFLTHPALAAAGAGIVAWGANAIQNRELAVFQPDIPFSRRVQEMVARIWGVGFVLAGLLLLGYGVLTTFNPRSPIPARLEQFFATAQGVSLLVLGGSILGIVFALSVIFVNDLPTGNSILRTLLSVPKRLYGVLLLLVFSAVGVISVLEIFEPGTWQRLAHLFLQRIGLE